MIITHIYFIIKKMFRNTILCMTKDSKSCLRDLPAGPVAKTTLPVAVAQV